MDAQHLLNASVLDIIFEGRNKEYGAYCLRKEYNGRLIKALFTTAVIVVSVILIFSFKGSEKVVAGGFIIIDTVTLEPPPEKLPEPVELPKAAAPPPMFQTVKLTSPPRIMRDVDVSPDDMPPEHDALDHVKIDVFNQHGIDAAFNVVPPQGTSNGVIGNISDSRIKDDSIFIRVEVESAYPGGSIAWSRFLNKTFTYPEQAVSNGIQGTVIVKFIVDQKGDISNVEAVDGPDELRREAIRVIKKSGKWNPAIQNGRMVKSYKQQPINFRLATD